ncbi:MAG: TonB-dependent receptor [Muribaculaceae bacterium]|nr:TonB-dependent receptor [Muribaculaceae bacterium]
MFYRHLDLKEVVVTGATGATKLKESSAPVSLLSARQLEATTATNIIDAVASMPGVSQVTTGSGISKPVIRGLGYNRIVVVSDGIRQEGQQWGDEHGIEVDAASVSSVEVLKGPGSLVYGSDALAGVLRFNSAPIVPLGKMRAGLMSEYQTNNGLVDYSLYFSGNNRGNVWNARYSEKWAHAYKNRYDGYVPNSQFHERAAQLMGGVNRHWGHSRLTLTYYNITPSIIEGERDQETGELVCEYGRRTQYGHGMPYQQVYHYKAAWDNTVAVGGGKLNALLGYQLNRRQEFEDAEHPNDYELYFKLHTLSYNIHYVTAQLSGWRVTGGVGGMYQHSLNAGEEYLIPDYNLFDVGVFATATKQFDRWTLNGGLRYDHRHLHSKSLMEDGEERFSDLKRNFGGVTGSVGAVLHAGEHWDLRANVSRGFRAPNISELTSNGVHEGSVRYELGDARLKPEYSLQFDLGADFTASIVSMQLSLFASHIDNFIFLHRVNEVVEEGFDTYRFDSGDSRLWGGELSIDVHPTHHLHLGTSFDLVRAVLLHQPNESRNLPFTPAPRWKTDVKYEFMHDGRVLNNAYVALGVDYTFKQNHYYAAYGTETATPAYALLNASAGTDIMSRGRRVATIAIIASNLTDKAYQNHLSRLKMTDVNPITGRRGVFNMGRNITFKLSIPLEW